MGPLTRIAAAGLAAAAVAVAVVLSLGRVVPGHASTAAAALTVRAAFSPPAAQFGDRVVARVVVVADRSSVDTNDLRIAAGVAPLTQLAAPRIVRANRGRLAVVTYEVRAVCIDESCIARKGTKELRLAPVRVDATLRRGGGRAHVTKPWPLLDLHSRVDAADLATGRPSFRADASYPAVTYRVAPGTLAGILDAVAALLAVAGVAWAAWQAAVLLRRRRGAGARSELERAVALVREAERRPGGDRRRAVGLLARVVRGRDTELATDAGELAWSRPTPEPSELEALAERVETER